MTVDTIAGAYFVEANPQWRCHRSQTSADGRRLARVYEAADGTFRVLRFVSEPGEPQWSGRWWGEGVPRSIAGTFADAERLADEFLRGERDFSDSVQ